MIARTADVALCLDVYDRLMAAFYAGPAGGVVSPADPADAILAKALEYRAMLITAPFARDTASENSVLVPPPLPNAGLSGGQ